MSESNDITLEAYENNLQAYLDGTPHEVSGEVKEWIDQALGMLDDGARILELGSGFGRDANYIRSKGYAVYVSDAAGSFVEQLRKNGFKARQLNILKEEIEGKFDMVFANAVLLHFSPDELDMVLAHIIAGLKSGGLLSITLKKGSGSEWSEAKLGARRFFQYWELPDIEDKLSDTGFDVIWSRNGDVPDAKWLQIIAKCANERSS